MRSFDDLLRKMQPYDDLHWYYWKDEGYIVWKEATGNNVEILFIEVDKKRQGIATRLMAAMVAEIKPYHSVIVFRLAANETAGQFYRALGFVETRIPGLYRGDDAVLGVVSYETLKQRLGAAE